MAPSNLRGYLTIVPRGFESTTCSIISAALASFECVDLRILQHDCENEQDVAKLTEQLRQQQRKKRDRKSRQKKWVDGSAQGKAEVDNESDASPIMGTLQHPNGGGEISLGHHNGRTVLSVPGPIEGVALLQFYTDAPPGIVAGIRGMGCGPLLALVATSHHKEQSKGGMNAKEILQYNQTLDEATTAVSNYIHCDKLEYVSKLQRALSLWFEHANEVWFANDGSLYGLGLGKEGGKDKREALQRKFHGALPFSFRVSCLRSHTKKYDWKRDEIMSALADLIVPVDELSGVDMSLEEAKSGSNESREAKKSGRWKVDLKHYDFEVVAIFHHNTVTVAVPLRPYQHLSAKNYSSGRLPPDVSPPYVIGSLLNSVAVVRLRPSTADQLLHLANVQPGDVVLDPCGGVGTIPIEASLSGRRCLGLGGDVVLTEDFAAIASNYLSAAKSQQSQAPHGGVGVSDMLAWDASLLPIRDACVDCIISDLPFGVQCLSSAKLSGFLPLLMSECARVLRPRVGRMVFLCGSYQGVLDAIADQNSVANLSVFELPCTNIFPVNIGGIAAWVVIIKRDAGKAVRIQNQSQRARKIASIRKRVEVSTKGQSTGKNKQQTDKAKFRRVQS